MFIEKLMCLGDSIFQERSILHKKDKLLMQLLFW